MALIFLLLNISSNKLAVVCYIESDTLFIGPDPVIT